MYSELVPNKRRLYNELTFIRNFVFEIVLSDIIASC